MNHITFKDGQLIRNPIKLDYAKPKILVPSTANGGPEFQAEMESIVRGIITMSLEVATIDTFWPRDIYNVQGGLHITQSEFGDLASGATTIYGTGFVLIQQESIFMSYVSNPVNSVKAFGENRQDVFPGLDIYTGAPNSTAQSLEIAEQLNSIPSDLTIDLDMLIGSVPSKNLLTIDSTYYMANKQFFDKVEKNHDTRIRPIQFPDKETQALFGNNYLLVEDGFDAPVALVNKATPQVSEVLRGEGVVVYETDIPLVATPTRTGASIRCLTNLIYSEEFYSQLKQIPRPVNIRREPTKRYPQMMM